jgi:hypothetical protein
LLVVRPAQTLFAVNYTGLKTDPGVFRFCQIEWIITGSQGGTNACSGIPTPNDLAAMLWQGFFWQRRTNKAMLFGYGV